jgi:membrane-associated phospholipid phosphatase
VLRALGRLDVAVLRTARTRGHTARMERSVAVFSRLGEHGLIWLGIGAAAALVCPRRRSDWGRAVATVLGAYLANTALKLGVRRRRPRLAGLPPLIGTPTGLSFPSSHATTSFAAAGLYRRLGAPGGPLMALALALSLSRLYLGVHYPSDVIAGALGGTLVARAAGRSVTS